MIDTGWASEDIGLVKSFGTALEASAIENVGSKVTRKMASGTAEVGYFPSVSLTIHRAPGFAFVRPGVEVSDWWSLDADAIFGWSVLRQFRVTIDFPRKGIHLEPLSLESYVPPDPGKGSKVFFNGKSYSVPNGGTISISPDGTVTVNPPQ